MILCMPTMSDDGLDAEICGHFGSAPWFVFYDGKTGAVEAVLNVKAEHEHGQCRPMAPLNDRGIAAVVCKGMGRNALLAVERRGIKVFVTDGVTVCDAVNDFREGRLVRLDPAAGCQGHACH